MTTPFIGEIQEYGFNFAPRGWAFCAGQLLPIAQNTALFSLLGTQYGGNGTTNFQLPNLQGRSACSQGQSPGLSDRVIGETFGTTSVTLTAAQTPAHSHAMTAFVQNDPAKRSSSPAAGAGISTLAPANKQFVSSAPNTTFAPTMLAAAIGGGQPHANQQPYLAINFCIALQGVYPARG